MPVRSARVPGEQAEPDISRLGLDAGAVECGHGCRRLLCHLCHELVCELRHREERGYGCRSGSHDTCSGFTPPFDTYRCDCMCHRLFWPE
ncbi:hypothetical protein AB0F17_34255 [Nonomuraea sp. NPDC026600]|uniref:hypothetical protein n=1 Tax=Nonomuraea sp. NPDC026600 TaxID=3155363 RepID=UPI0033DD1DCB